jgi:hypothetical protein
MECYSKFYPSRISSPSKWRVKGLDKDGAGFDGIRADEGFQALSHFGFWIGGMLEQNGSLKPGE